MNSPLPATTARPARRSGDPLLVGEGAAPLIRDALGGGGGGEAWLQALIHEHPDILPIRELEPGFGMPVAIAREVKCGHGYIDNLLITPAGEIVLVEAKLWANPQARREVVAQVLDYVSALMAMGLEALEAAVRYATKTEASLYARVADQSDALGEAAFNDALARNLRDGRMLVLVVGDGITEESERLAGLLQGPVSARFTLALVQLAVFRLGEAGPRLVVPSTIARTVMVERGVISLAEPRLIVAEPPAASVPAGARTISGETFDALLDARRPGLAQELRAFAASLEPLGVYVDEQASLILKLDQADGRNPINLGYVQRNGQLKTTAVEWFAPPDVARRYLERFAAAIGGSVVQCQHRFVSLDGKTAPRIEQVLPVHAEAWRGAIGMLVREVAESEARA